MCSSFRFVEVSKGACVCVCAQSLLLTATVSGNVIRALGERLHLSGPNALIKKLITARELFVEAGDTCRRILVAL